MEGCIFEYNAEESEVSGVVMNKKGIALVMALIISLGIMVLVTGALYFTIQSTSISGAGKKYSTGEEAANGAIEIIKEGINSVQRTDPVPYIINDPSVCFRDTAIKSGLSCTATITLPGTVGTYYTAAITFQNLFRVGLPGSRIEFGRAAGSAAATAIYYRIIVSITDSTNTINAENSVLYRFTN